MKKKSLNMSENVSGTADFDFVPIVEVTTDNIKELEPAIRAAIANSDLVSIDCVRLKFLFAVF